MLIFPIFIPQQGCPFKCIYCDQVQFDAVNTIPHEMISSQLAQFCAMHSGKTKQVAFYGGTFTGLETSVRDTYYQLIEPFLDNQMSIRISTRPDFIDAEILNWSKEHHITTIELGIQDFNNEVLKSSQRGYNNQQAINACKIVKQFGFELGVQLMPGLPNSTKETHRMNMEALQIVKPDFIRLYPVIVLAETPLWSEWQAGKYTPLSLDQAIDICIEYYDWAALQNIRISKIGIPSLEKGRKYAGPYHAAFGELVKGEILIRKIAQNYNQQEKIRISAHDISMLTGHKGYNLNKLQERFKKCSIKIEQDTQLRSGEIRFSIKG